MLNQTIRPATEDLPQPRNLMPLDLEDPICRVHWMAQIAWEDLCGLGVGQGGEADTKVRHLVRATAELAEQLYDLFRGRAPL